MEALHGVLRKTTLRVWLAAGNLCGQLAECDPQCGPVAERLADGPEDSSGREVSTAILPWGAAVGADESSVHVTGIDKARVLGYCLGRQASRQ